MLDKRKQENTITNIAVTTFITLIWIATFCAILTTLGVNVAALLTGTGSIGVIRGS